MNCLQAAPPGHGTMQPHLWSQGMVTGLRLEVTIRQSFAFLLQVSDLSLSLADRGCRAGLGLPVTGTNKLARDGMP